MKTLVGKSALIRTVTYHWVGHVVAVEDGFCHLREASYLGDTGRYGTVLRDNWDQYTEIEPVPGDGCAVVAVAAIVDATEWPHPLPRDQR